MMLGRSLPRLERLVRWLLVPLSVLVAVFAYLFPARIDLTASYGGGSSQSGEPAVLILAPEHADAIRDRLAPEQRVYIVKNWTRPRPEVLAQLLSEVDEDEIILVGQTSEHLRTDTVPESDPRIVGRVAMQRPVDEVAWSVSRLAALSSVRSTDSTAKRALYRIPPRRA
jgi:hypothetical protein